MIFHCVPAKLSIYTLKGGIQFCSPLKINRFLIFLLMMVGLTNFSQAQKLDVPVKIEVDNGDTEGVLVKVTRDGKDYYSQTGSKNIKLKLEFNQNYVLTFSKAGYITKTIEFDTKAPADRIEEGFEPYKIGIKLFVQQKENTVMYNQAVGKIRFEDSMDDFQFETDYSKSILSDLDAGDKNKSKTDAKADPMNSPASPSDEKARPSKTSATSSNENNFTAKDAGTDPEKNVHSASPQPTAVKGTPLSNSSDRTLSARSEMNKQQVLQPGSGASSSTTLQGAGGDDGPVKKIIAAGDADWPEEANAINEDEKVTREEIVEKNRTIIKVKVSSSAKDTHYSVVQYNWGGRYYFRGNTSITETLFTQWTGVQP